MIKIKESIKIDNCKEVLYKSEYEWTATVQEGIEYALKLKDEGYSYIPERKMFVKYVPHAEPTVVSRLTTVFEEA